MKYEFVVTNVPPEISGYNLPAYTEGHLCIKDFRENEVFLDVSGILLIELAIVLKKWLLELSKADSIPPDLYYASMDFEEEPIFALNYSLQEGAFIPHSAWQLQSNPPSVISQVAKIAAEDYLQKLEVTMASEFSVQVGEVIDNEVAAQLER